MSASDDAAVARLLRDLAPQVLGAVARRHGDFDAAEEAVQEAERPFSEPIFSDGIVSTCLQRVPND